MYTCTDLLVRPVQWCACVAICSTNLVVSRCIAAFHYYSTHPLSLSLFSAIFCLHYDASVVAVCWWCPVLRSTISDGIYFLLSLFFASCVCRRECVCPRLFVVHIAVWSARMNFIILHIIYREHNGFCDQWILLLRCVFFHLKQRKKAKQHFMKECVCDAKREISEEIA